MGVGAVSFKAILKVAYGHPDPPVLLPTSCGGLSIIPT